METVEFRRIPQESGQAVGFLKEHVKGRIKTKGTQVQVEGAKHKDLKLLLHKFLRHRGLEGYRVVSQSGILEIVPEHHAAHSAREAGTAPSAAATMPYFFPGSPPLKVEKKVKARREP
ncbi:hypothetical protein J2P12_01675 [Candidatus Bathyarchaeota archaeon]|nr:hypothetical protein [Candidatus Bathyarchaeota archaeon]